MNILKISIDNLTPEIAKLCLNAVKSCVEISEMRKFLVEATAIFTI